MPQQIAMTPLAGIASGVERGLNAVSTMQDIEQKKQAIAINNMKMQEEQARQADMNKVTSKQILFDNLQMGENVRKSVEPFYGMFANPDGNITKKNTFEMMKFLESNPMAKQKMLEGRHADVQKEYDNSKLMLEEAKQSGNPKKIQQATQNYNMASQKLSGITQAMTDEKGNRLALIGKYGADAERFYNGEISSTEFADAVRERELAKQKEKPQDKWSEPYEASIGGKKGLVQRNETTGQIKPVMQDVSTTVKVNVAGGDKEKPPSKKDSITLRKEFNGLPEVKESNMIMPKISSMEKAYSESLKTKNFVAVDQALITLYNKLTDPNSVVRESEYARTAMNIPLLNQIKGKVNKILSGGAGLTTEERNALIKMARLMRDGYKEIRSKRVEEYRSYADDFGFNGKEIIKDPYADNQTKRPLPTF
jgi:hypothetical protein